MIKKTFYYKGLEGVENAKGIEKAKIDQSVSALCMSIIETLS